MVYSTDREKKTKINKNKVKVRAITAFKKNVHPLDSLK